MSVVNKMLQDLEARKEEPEINADYQPPRQNRSDNWFWLIAILLVIMVIAVWLGYNAIKTNQDPIVPIEAGFQQAQTKELISTAPQSASTNTHKESNNLSAPLPINTSSTSQTMRDKTVDTHRNSDIVDSHRNSDIVDSQLNNMDTHLLREKTQLPESEDSIALVEGPAANEQNNVKQPSVKSPSPILKVKTQQTGNETQQIIADQRQGPLQGTFAVTASNTVASEAELSQQVQIAIKRGDERIATELLEKLVTLSPDNEKARKRLASMLFSQGKHDQANGVLQQGIELQPDNHELRLMQAKLYVQMKNPSKAHELLANHTISAVQAMDFVSYRAALAQRVERFSAAKQDYLELTELQPANAKWWLGLAVAQERLGNTKMALQAYKNAKQLAQLSVEVDKFVEQRIQYLAGVN